MSHPINTGKENKSRYFSDESNITSKDLLQLIDDGDNSGHLVKWNMDAFLKRMKEKSMKK